MTEHAYDIIVVGGSAAGLTAAITARRHFSDKKIVLIRQEEQAVIPCGIPYIFGTVGRTKKNLLPDGVLGQNNIDLCISAVNDIRTGDHQVTLSNGDTYTYEKLILATGSTPIVPPIKGVNKPNVKLIHKDADKLRALQKDMNDTKNLVIIGGGFIGIELADECKKAGVENVTVVEMLPHCLMLSFDEEFCVQAEKLMEERGVKIIPKTRVMELAGNGKVDGVVLDNGQTLPADMVIIGAGAKANVSLAENANLRLGPTGAVAVDRYMRTSDLDVFACGDCTEKKSFFGGLPSGLKLASIAATEARIAAANLYGPKRENIGTIGVWSTAIGELAMAGAGLTEQMAKELNFDCVVGKVAGPNRHPAVMPGADEMTAKLIFERRTGVLIGGELAGPLSVGELINTVSASISSRMTYDDIASFQIGTHPALTSSPVAYQLVNAAELACMASRKSS